MTTEGPPTSGPSPRPLHWDARRVLRALGPLPPATAPALVVLCGLPGAGKSTLARTIAAQAPVAVVGSDHIRKTLVKVPQYTDREHRRVFAAAHAVTRHLLMAGVPVVFDAVNHTHHARRSIGAVAARCDAPVLVVEVTAGEAVVRRRLQQRAIQPDTGDLSDATWEVHLALAEQAEPVAAPDLVVHTDDGDLANAVAAIRTFLEGPPAGA